jgi:hypothetical protein
LVGHGAIHPVGDRFVLGSNQALSAFDASGTQLWRRPVPGTVYAVNITGDSRLVVAAYAFGLAGIAEHNREIMIRTNSRLPPGTKLHLLAIGISAYNEDYAKNLRLQYADRDARDLASAITNTQGSLYADVTPQVLLDKDANKGGILRALETMRAEMKAGDGDDLAVVYFSSHGALVDRQPVFAALRNRRAR